MKPHSQEELRKKYGTYDPNDYRIPENLPGIRDKLRYKKYIEDSVRELEKLAKETRERLNFGNEGAKGNYQGNRQKSWIQI